MKRFAPSSAWGFVFVDQRGSHIRLSRGSVRITIPNHNPILPKSLQSMLRQAGVSLEEFLDAR
jgi:predicted RNA binding protein YcfA (HicA-like mRNA interferase family)